MRSAGVISVFAAFSFSLLSVTRVAGAAGELPTAGARLELHALPDCTSREELVARVIARSRRIHFDDDPSGPLLRAVIAPAPRGGAVGELLITGADGKTSSRRISAPSCAEATDAIALIIALTLDPTSASSARVPAETPPAGPGTAAATSTETPTTREEPPPPPTERAAEQPAATARTAELPGSRASEPLAPPSDGTGALAVPKPAPRLAAERRFGAGVGAQLIIGATPNVLPGVSIYLLAGLDREALWSPAVLLSGIHAATSGLVESGGIAAFTFDAISLDACALRVHLSAFEARACATGLYGRLGASGSETYSPASATRPYAMAGGALVFGVRIIRPLEISGRFGGGASLVRDAFAFSPTVFHRTAAATFVGSLQLGVRFP